MLSLRRLKTSKPSYEDCVDFYSKIPKDLKGNLDYREKLYNDFIKNPKSIDLFLAMCEVYLPIIFTSIFWTLNPQKEAGSRDIPFILWPKQVKVVEELDKAIKAQQYDFGIWKTRKQGATEVVAKTFAAHCMLYEYSNFVVGSRKKDLVDSTGDFYTIFAKIDHVFNRLPSSLKEVFGSFENGKIERKDMSLKIPLTNSTINGETTNESFKAGSRSTAMFLDEFGRVKKLIAESIEGSVHDICNCVVYGSTHWFGPSHTFNKCLQKSSTKTMTLFWHENEMSHQEVNGLYSVPETGEVVLEDLEYYRQNYPEILKYAT